jgi:hypothetical protein
LYQSFQHAIVYAVALFTSALIAFNSNNLKPSKWQGVLPFVVVAGAVANFMDMSTGAPVGGLLASFAVASGLASSALKQKRLAPKPYFLTLVALSLAWWISYFLTWSAKWILASFWLSPATVIDNVRESIAFRVSSPPEISGIFGHLKAMQVSFAAWVEYPFATWSVIGTLLLIVFALVLYSLVVRGKAALYIFILIAFPAVSVPIWLGLFANHTWYHSFFLYRGWAYVLGALFAAALTTFLRVRGLASNTKQQLNGKA